MGINVNSGGLSKGGPIWPGGKPTSSKELSSADEVFQSHKEVGAAQIKTSGPASAQETQSAQQAQKAAPKTPISETKSLTPKDIMQQLANIKVPVNDQNQELALLMAAHGVEINEDSFAQLNKLLKGKKSRYDKESAVLLMSKGLADVSEDTSILKNLLSKNSSIANTLQNLQSMQQKMGTLLNRSLADYPELQSFLSLFDDFNDDLKKIKKMDRNNRWLSSSEEFMDDLFAMKGFLAGLKDKGIVKNAYITKYLAELASLKQNLLAQMILSQNSIKQPLGLLESFHYFQIPNPLAVQAMIEILLRKQTSANSQKDKSSKKDGQKEKIILSIESENLGKVTIIVTVMGFKIWCQVFSDKEDAIHHVNAFRKEFSESLAKYQYQLEEFKTARKKINIQKFIAPSQDISEVKRVQAEI